MVGVAPAPNEGMAAVKLVLRRLNVSMVPRLARFNVTAPSRSLPALVSSTDALVAVSTVTVVVPDTTAAPVWLTLPLDTTARLEAPMAPRLVPMVLLMVTAPPVTPMVPVNALAASSVTVPEPALTLVAPLTVAAPVCVTSSLVVVTPRLLAPMVPRTVAIVFLTLTAPPVTPMVPVMALSCVSVTLLVPALTSTAPLTVSTPSCVTLPLPVVDALMLLATPLPRSSAPVLTVSALAVAVRAPTLSTPRFRPFASLICVVVPVSVTEPWKSLVAVLRLMPLAPALTLVKPVTVTEPLFWVTAPPALIVRLSAVTVSSAIAPVDSRSVTEVPVAPTLAKALPVLSSVTTPPAPLKVAVPTELMVVAVFCVMPTPVTFRPPEPVTMSSSTMAFLSTTVMALAPALPSFTAPVKSLLVLSSVSGKLPAVIHVLPATVTPSVVCVTPWAPTVRSPAVLTAPSTSPLVSL